MYVVVLAGGGGTRLWPVSRPDRPKPFLPLLGPETLFQRSVLRAAPLVGSDSIFVVVAPRYERFVRDQAPAASPIVEPAARNTAAAIALAAGAIERPDDEVMVVLPTDHWIEREAVFVGVLADAERELAQGAFGIPAPLVTLGVQVTRPSTEYGYLIPDPERGQGPTFGTGHRLDAYHLRWFEEKPTAERALALQQQPGVAWNAGMFLWQRGAIRRALRDFAPAAAAIADAETDADRARAYDEIDPTSIDRAVMEPAAAAGRVVMGSMDVGWSDLGSWTSLLASLPGAAGATGRVLQPGESAVLGEDDLLISGRNGRLDLVVGPRDTIALDTPSALLAGARSQEPAVRALLERVAAEESQT
jgi:mannose-1-phosphate guanylyltransferase